MEHEFDANHQKWTTCDPFSLFDCAISTSVKGDCRAIENNLKAEARRANTLMIWTDCDREGENIGSEIATVCRKANPNIRVQRARFSALIAKSVPLLLHVQLVLMLETSQIHHAMQNPVELDMNQAHSVDARTILDLRLGAAFTRMQTLALQQSFPELSQEQRKSVISYGECSYMQIRFSF